MAKYGSKALLSEQIKASSICQENLEHWLIETLAIWTGVDIEKFDTDESIFIYGLDSSVALIITGDLEKLLSLDLSPSLFWEHSTISELAAYLYKEVSKR